MTNQLDMDELIKEWQESVNEDMKFHALHGSTYSSAAYVTHNEQKKIDYIRQLEKEHRMMQELIEDHTPLDKVSEVLASITLNP